jgi:DNA ligase-1
MNPVILYKLTNANLLSWGISVSGNKVVIEHGVYRGKLQVDIHACPSNDAAITEMQRRIAVKKTKQGYTTHIPSSVPDLPMLASTYNPATLPEQILIQPKLDGIRCVATHNTMRTRRNEPIQSLPHIQEALSTLPPGVKLDGELYCHGLSFQEHLSIVKRNDPHRDYSKMYYHVFDVQTEDLPFVERYKLLFDILDKVSSQYVIPVKTVLCAKTDIPSMARTHFLNYEGAIIRDPNGMYQNNHRSSSLQKYKWSETAECQIVDIIAPTTGRSEGAAIFICRHPTTGQQFKAVPKLSIYIRKSIFENKDSLIGYWARVTYDALSNKGVPLKPRAEAYAYKPEDLQ